MTDNADLESKDIYLAKVGEDGYIGLHEMGTYDGPDWHRLESWANSYDEHKKFVASISRIFGPIEEAAEDMKAEGWERVDWEKK